MKRYIIIIICALAAIAAGAQTVQEQIEQHRQWVRDHTPKPEDLSNSQLIIAAAQAITNESYEPELCAMIKACGKWNPVLTDYAQWKSQGLCDKGYLRVKAAMEALSQVARDIVPKDVYCQTMVDIFFSMVLYSTGDKTQSLELLKDCSSRFKDGKTERDKAMHLFSLVCYESVRLDAEGENPLFWERVVDIENQAYALYGENGGDDLVAYNTFDQLAILKIPRSQTIVPYNIAMRHLRPELQAKMELAPATYTVDDARFWFNRASTMADRLFGPGNMESSPLCIDMSLYAMMTWYSGDDIDDLYGVLLNKYNLAQAYYKEPNQEMCNLAVTLDNMLCNLYANDWQRLNHQEQTLADSKKVFGENSEDYLSMLLYYVGFAMNTGRQDEAKAMEQRLLDAIDKFYGSRLAEKMQWTINNAQLRHLSLSSMEYHEYLIELLGKYEAMHEPTWHWVNTGKSLVNLLCNNSIRNLALRVQRCVISDKQQLLPADHVSLAEEYAILGALTDEDFDAKIAACEHEIAIYDKAGEPCQSEKAQLGELYAQRGDYGRAIPLVRTAYEECVAQNDTASMTCNGIMLAKILNDEGTHKQEAALLFDRYTDMMMAVEGTSNDHVQPTIDAAIYYLLSGQPKRAVDLLDHTRYCYEGLNLPLNSDYTQLVRLEADIYLSTLDDYDKALKLIEDCLAVYERQSTTEGNEMGMIDLLDLQLGIIQSKGRKSMNSLSLQSQCILRMGQLALDLWNASGQSLDVYYGTLLRSTLRYSLLFPFFGEPDAKQSPDYDRLKGQIELLANEVLLPAYQNFPSYSPYYRNNNNYWDLLHVLAEYYEYVEDDQQKAEHFYKLYVDETEQYAYMYVGPAYSYYYAFLMRHSRYDEALAYQLKAQESSWTNSASTSSRLYDASGLFATYSQLGRKPEAITPARDVFMYSKELYEQNFDLMTQNERETMIGERGTGAGPLKYLLETFPDELSQETYDAVLFEKNLLLRSAERVRRSILKSGNKELIAAMDSLEQMRVMQRLLPVPVAGHSADSLRYWEVTHGIENLERQIARESAQYRTDSHLQLTWQKVRSELRPGEAAVEYVLSESKTGMLILRKDLDKPLFVPLSKTDELYNQIVSLTGLPAEEMADVLYQEDRFGLYSKLWQGAEKALEGIKTVYFSPSGYLSTLALEAMRLPDGSALMDRYELHRLSSTALLQNRSANASLTHKFSSAQLFGGICYSEDQLAEVGTCGVGKVRGKARNANRGADTEPFIYLSQTVDEVNNIGSLLRSKMTKSAQCVTNGELDATEQRVRALSEHSPEILHLATHGFYLADEGETASIPFFDRYPSMRGNSMIRSGLAFANANYSWEGENAEDESTDGILTASEIATLDLSSTRLAVLSACETATGAYTLEGVYGIQRGFKQAGVRSIMASLWSVSDDSTSLLMQQFYQNWLGGKSIYDSLHGAISTVRQSYPSPYNWAAFVMLDDLQ